MEYVLRNPRLEGSPFYWEAGQTGVLLIHGVTATTAEVRPLAQYLRQAGYSVAGPLLPGHGTNPLDANHYTWQDWAATVENAYLELNKKCMAVIIGGESLGGLLALHLAASRPAAAGLLIYSPVIRFKKWYVKPLANILSPFKKVAQKPAGPLSAADALWQGYPVYPIQALRQISKLQSEVRRRLREIGQPLLLIQGRLDRSVHSSGPEIIYNSVSSQIKEMHWLEQSGHCAILDCQRQQANDLTLAFLQKILPSSA